MTAALQFEANPVLFGHGTRPGLLAVEPAEPGYMRLYGQAGAEEVPFRPYLWLTTAELLAGLKVVSQVQELAGQGAYRVLATFDNWADLMAARRHVMKVSKGRSEGSTHLFLNDMVQQYLTQSGETLFKGMLFRDLVRLQLHVEICSPPDEVFSHDLPHVMAVGIQSSRGFQAVLTGDTDHEAELLGRLSAIIAAENPDVIEGHDLFREHLPYLQERARRHGLKLDWGRDKSAAVSRTTRISFAEKVVDYPRFDIQGRHVVDTWLLVQLYDISSRDLDGYALAEAAQYFGTLPDDGTLDAEQKLSWSPSASAGMVPWCAESVRQVALLAETLSPSYFLQAQMLPYSYQNVVVRGNATKINALFLREYLRRGQSLPQVPDDYNTYEGGLTQVFEEGVIANIVHCDVASLYPSLMLVYHLAPRRDELGVFLPLLEDLRTFRLQAKRAAQEAPTFEERHHFTALQQTFKILINSFYGYLGTSFSNFADTVMAAEVTQKGRDLINQVIEQLRRHGCRPIELDTDGVYFVPPPEVPGATVVEFISQDLPAGIRLETDATYPAMFSHKTKNYALLTEAGEVLIKGSGLRSRGVERYLRHLTEDIIRRLLEGRSDDLPRLFDDLMTGLAARTMPIRQLTKTETLSETLDTYRNKVLAKKRNAAAAYELAIKSGRRYRPGEQVTYYVAGDAKKVRLFDQCRLVQEWQPHQRDENVAYYQQKARETFERFLPYYPPESPLHQLLAKKPAKPKNGQQELL